MSTTLPSPAHTADANDTSLVTPMDHTPSPSPDPDLTFFTPSQPEDFETLLGIESETLRREHGLVSLSDVSPCLQYSVPGPGAMAGDVAAATAAAAASATLDEDSGSGVNDGDVEDLTDVLDWELGRELTQVMNHDQLCESTGIMDDEVVDDLAIEAGSGSSNSSGDTSMVHEIDEVGAGVGETNEQDEVDSVEDRAMMGTHSDEQPPSALNDPIAPIALMTSLPHAHRIVTHSHPAPIPSAREVAAVPALRKSIGDKAFAISVDGTKLTSLAERVEIRPQAAYSSGLCYNPLSAPPNLQARSLSAIAPPSQSPIRREATPDPTSHLQNKWLAFRHAFDAAHSLHSPAQIAAIKYLAEGYSTGAVTERDFYASLAKMVCLRQSKALMMAFWAWLPPARQTGRGWDELWGGAVEACREIFQGRAEAARLALLEKEAQAGDGAGMKRVPINGFRAGTSSGEVEVGVAVDSMDVDGGEEDAAHESLDEDEIEEDAKRASAARRSPSKKAATPASARPKPQKSTKSSTMIAIPDSANNITTPKPKASKLTPNNPTKTPSTSSTPSRMYGPGLRSSGPRTHISTLPSTQITHYGPVYPSRRAILARADRPYICHLCHSDFLFPRDVYVHFTGYRIHGSGCWVEHGSPVGEGREKWDLHPSCKVGLSGLRYGKCRDGFVVLDQESLDAVKRAVEAGRDFKRLKGLGNGVVGESAEAEENEETALEKYKDVMKVARGAGRKRKRSTVKKSKVKKAVVKAGRGSGTVTGSVAKRVVAKADSGGNGRPAATDGSHSNGLDNRDPEQMSMGEEDDLDADYEDEDEDMM